MSAPRPEGQAVRTLARGRYELGRLLGAGGMGLVHQARDVELHRDVAVKLLADNLAADPVARERFLREARAAARLVHPNVVTVHDVGSDADRPYLVMELVDGPSLASIQRAAGVLSGHEVVEVAIDALAGLGQAHAADLLHRDLKPGNLLRGSDRTVKVTDFGVAEAADVPGITRTGTVVGTLPYLAPERRRGEPASVRSDLYALGVTLAELATGEPPEPGASVTLDDHAPPGLRSLVAALTAPRPDDRPLDAEAAFGVLSGEVRARARPATTERRHDTGRPTIELSTGQPTAALHEGDGEGAAGVEGGSRPPHPRRQPLVAIAVVLVAVLVAGGLVVRPAADGRATGADEVVERVEDDPAATMRNLGDWLREPSER